MVNDDKDKKNQIPTGEGKKQSRELGEPHKLNKRSDVLQASSAEQNVGSAEEEDSFRSSAENPARPKAGR